MEFNLTALQIDCDTAKQIIAKAIKEGRNLTENESEELIEILGKIVTTAASSLAAIANSAQSIAASIHAIGRSE